MEKRKAIALGAVALGLSLIVGGITTASATTASQAVTSTNPVIAGACGLGLRMGAALRDTGGRLVDIVAELTGQSVEDVQAKRASGTTLAEIAADEGVSSDKVVGTAVDAREELLDARVKDGTITQAQADQALENMESRLTARLSSSARGGGAGACGGAGGGRGSGGGGCGGCAQAPAAQ